MLNKSKMLQLEALAKRACNIGYEQYGTSWCEIAPGVKTYTAEALNHQAAEFFEIGVSLLRSPKVEISLNTIDKIDTIIIDTTKILDDFEAEMAAQSEVEAKQSKRDRIDALKLQLADLEGSHGALPSVGESNE